MRDLLRTRAPDRIPTTTDITVRSIADVPWDDVGSVFDTRGNPSSTCWSQYFKLPNAAWKSVTKDECAAMLQQQ